MFLVETLLNLVKLDNGLTSNLFSSVGVRQVCPLSPSLFNIFLNDLSERFMNECVQAMLNSQNIRVLMHADALFYYLRVL